MARQDATMTTSAEDAAMLAQATNGTAPAATNGTSTDTATGTETAAPAKRTRTRREPSDDPNELFGITVRVPQELKNKLDESAKAQDTSTPQFILRGLAGWYEYKLPEAAKKTRRVQKYATEAEKKQAQRESQANSRLRVRALLAAVENGILGDVTVEALVEDLKARQAAAAAEDAATAAATSSTATEQPAEMATAGAGAAS